MLSVRSPASSSLSRAGEALLAVMLVLLVGLNLRPILAAIGPLLDEIHAATGLGSAGAGALTNLPIAAMGYCALGGAMFHAHLAVRRILAPGLTPGAQPRALRNRK